MHPDRHFDILENSSSVLCHQFDHEVKVTRRLDLLTPGSLQRRVTAVFQGFRKTSCDFGQIFMENDSGTFGSIRPVLEKIMESSFQCPTFYLWANSFEAVLFVLCIRTVHWFGSLRNSACMHLLSC